MKFECCQAALGIQLRALRKFKRLKLVGLCQHNALRRPPPPPPDTSVLYAHGPCARSASPRVARRRVQRPSSAGPPAPPRTATPRAQSLLLSFLPSRKAQCLLLADICIPNTLLLQYWGYTVNFKGKPYLCSKLTGATAELSQGIQP